METVFYNHFYKSVSKTKNWCSVMISNNCKVSSMNFINIDSMARIFPLLEKLTFMQQLMQAYKLVHP